MTPLVIKFSPPSCYFRSHKLITFLDNVFSNSLNACSSFRARDQALRPDKIIVLRVLSFTFSHRKKEDKFTLFLVVDDMNITKYSVCLRYVSSQYAHLAVLRWVTFILH
jgi:hypothetical protein